MKTIKMFLFACILGLGLAGCSKVASTDAASYEVTCLTFFGPFQAELTAGQIKGLADSRATTYTLSLENGAELTLAKGACIVSKAPEAEAAKNAE